MSSLSYCRRLALAIIASFLAGSVAAGNDIKGLLANTIDLRSSDYTQIAHQIWELAEMGYLEHKSSGILQAEAQKEGFQIESGVAGIPTAFLATYGSGQPVIGIMAEFDALPDTDDVQQQVGRGVCGRFAGRDYSIGSTQLLLPGQLDWHCNQP